MSDNGRKARLEEHARFYARQRFAVVFTDGLDGDAAKRCSASGWEKTQPLADAEYAAGFIGNRGLKRNVAIALRTSDLVGVECDGAAELERVARLGLPVTLTAQSSAPDRLHFHFRPPAGAPLEHVSFRFEAGRVIAATNNYYVSPPSLHPDGAEYAFIEQCDPAGLPLALYLELAALAGKRPGRRRQAKRLPDLIPVGQRRTAMLSLAGSARRRGASGEGIYALLQAEQARCAVPLDDGELLALALDVERRYEPDSAAVPTVPAAPDRDINWTPRALDDVVETFQRHLHMPDPASLLLTLATVVANMMDEGDPVWLVNIGGSSRGKTEIVAALDGYPGIRVVGALTVASLLSGTARKDRARDATGGVLAELGERGVLVVKDFGALLVLPHEARAQVLQALRDIYDGLYTRDIGSDGGTKLRWQGRLGLIAGATSALDSAHGVLSALGERWVTTRLPDGGEQEMVEVALADTDTRGARAAMREAVHGFLSTLERVPLRAVTESEHELLSALAPLVVLARSPVERDSYKRDIVHVHSPEGPARIVRQLHKLLVSLEAMGVEQPAGLILRAGLDSIPSPRRNVLVQLLQHGEQSTTDIATTLGLARTNAERACEDLAAHRLLIRRKAGDVDNSPNLWAPAERVVRYWETLDRHRGESA